MQILKRDLALSIYNIYHVEGNVEMVQDEGSKMFLKTRRVSSREKKIKQFNLSRPLVWAIAGLGGMRGLKFLITDHYLSNLDAMEIFEIHLYILY